MKDTEKDPADLHQKKLFQHPETSISRLRPTRDKNIDYILELLTTRYSSTVHQLVTFDFSFDEYAKKLSIVEKEEYTVFITDTVELESLQKQRDDVSLENFLKFIAKFRLFNLDKMIQRVKNKPALNRVFEKGLGKTFFTYNHYTIEKGKNETVEEYCFHADSYEAVKKSLNIIAFRTIIAAYGEFVKNRLRKFGILNSDFGDYRDNKIDYILNILVDDIQSPVSPKDKLELKNFQTLRQCVLHVDKILDPVQTKNTDIVAYLKKTGFASAAELSMNVLNVTQDIISQWDTPERLLKEHIIKEKDGSGTHFYLDAAGLITHFGEVIELLKKETSVATAPLLARAALLHAAAQQVILHSSAQTMLGSSDAVNRLSLLVEEFNAFQKKKVMQKEAIRTAPVTPLKKRPLIVRVLSFITSLFSPISSSYSREDISTLALHGSEERPERKEPRKETQEIFEKTTQRKGPVSALSDFIELKPDNESLVLRIIQELRDNNMRIVVPIYNARTTLYPKRSGKLLISDVEYLLVPPQVIKSIDTISDYINSLVGFKLKDEPIPNRGLIALEKYLRILHRQRRASQMRKKEMREKTMKP